MIYFTGDQHFGHQNIIDYCDRPFTNCDQMDRTLIARYRQVVNPEDTIYFLGDFTIKGSTYKGYLEYIASHLVGRKILILGNHDKHNPFIYLEVGFESVHTSLEVEEFILAHDPAWAIMERRKTWLCGHVHTLFKKRRNVINVGVDQWEFFPVSITEIRTLISGNEDRFFL